MYNTSLSIYQFSASPRLCSKLSVVTLSQGVCYEQDVSKSNLDSPRDPVLLWHLSGKACSFERVAREHHAQIHNVISQTLE